MKARLLDRVLVILLGTRPAAPLEGAPVSFYPSIDCPGCGEEVLGAVCEFDSAADDGRPVVPFYGFLAAEFACQCGTTTHPEGLDCSSVRTVEFPEQAEGGEG